MFRRIGVVVALFFAGSAALAQSVQQSGSVTPNTTAIWNSTGVIKGGVTATDSPLTTFGVTRDAVDALCVSSARQTAAGRNQLCFQAATSGPAKISLQNYGTATAQDLQFILNGVTLTLPSGGGTFITGQSPYVVGHAACFNSISGIIQDCGVGISSGTQYGVPYYSATGTLTSTGAPSAGQLLLGQNAAAPLWTNLSGDVNSVSAGGALTLSKVNGIPFSSTYTAHGVLIAEGSSAFTSLGTASVGQCLLSQGTSSDPIWSSCAAGTGSAGGSNTQVQFNNATSLGGSANLTWVTPALTIGVAGTTTGQLALASSTATGTVTLQAPGVASAYNFNFPTGAGSLGQPLLSGGGGSTPNTFGTLGVAGGGTNCSAASGTCLDNITGFASTGFVQRTGAGTYAFSNVITVSGGGTGLANGTSGGIPAFTASGTMTSSGVLAQYSLVAGGGAGAVPATVTKGTAGQILIDQTSANPAWSTMSGDATINSAGAVTIANSAVTVGKMANAAAYTLMGNFTASSAAPQFSTMGSLTQKASPAAGDYLILQDNSAAGQVKYATVSSVAAAGSVASIAGNTGSFTLAGGVTNSTNQIQFDGKYASLNAGFNCTIAASVGSNLLTVAMKDAGGTDPSPTSPCYINYRDPTASTGTATLVTQTAALSVATTNTASAGAMGASNATAFRIWVVVFNNSGTNVLALINCSNATTIFPLNESVVASSTPFSASATSAGVFYTPSGTTVSSKAFRILGYIEYNSTGLVTAGTYATGPNFIQAFGPGVRKPGEVVQMPTSNTATVGSTTSAAFVALTNTPSQAITPTSAANPIRVTSQGTGILSTTGSAFLQILRGGSAIGNPVNLSATNGLSAPTILIWLDMPNSISAQTYTLQGKTSAGTLSYPGASTGHYFELQEIMG